MENMARGLSPVKHRGTFTPSFAAAPWGRQLSKTYCYEVVRPLQGQNNQEAGYRYQDGREEGDGAAGRSSFGMASCAFFPIFTLHVHASGSIFEESYSPPHRLSTFW